MEDYLLTVQELIDKSVADLGPMDTMTYVEAMKKGAEAASAAGLENWRLGVGIYFSDLGQQVNMGGMKETPYPILEQEWDVFIRDAKTMCVSMPRVYVIDMKYPLPI